jgi:CBS domain-containing protein
MRVKDLMTQPVQTVQERDTLDRAAYVMWNHDCGAVPVVNDDGRAVGMITDRDICMAALFHGQPLTAVPVSAVMSRELCACQPDDQVLDAERLMSTRQVHRLPILDQQGLPVGILAVSDIARRRPRQAGDGARQRPGWNAEVIETITAIWEPRHREPEAGYAEAPRPEAPARRRMRPPRSEPPGDESAERRH